MAYKEDSLDKVIGSLGFSFSSLPFRNGDVDIRQVTASADLFLEARFNFFDISSEYQRAATATIDALSTRYSRPSYCLSTTESSLSNYSSRFKRLGIEYYDFFALENEGITEENVAFLLSEKKEGRINHIGLRWTGDAATLKRIFLTHSDVEYVILPLSASDFSSKNERRMCYEEALVSSVPVIIEAGDRKKTEEEFPKEKADRMQKRHPSWPVFAWNLRFLYSLDGVVTVSMPLGEKETTKEAVRALRGFSSLDKEDMSLLAE